MAKFLLTRRIAGAGWAMAMGSQTISVLPTGSAIWALSRAKWLFQEGTEERRNIELALTEAAAWLEKSQNGDDGGWSVEVRDGERSDSRVISTCYAIRGFLALGETASSSRAVERAVEFLVSHIDRYDGGFAKHLGEVSDVCSTARAVFVLLEAGAYLRTDPVIKRAVKFLLDHRNEWRVSTEKYNAPGAPGMITYHGNAPYDVSLALLRFGYTGRELREIRAFFLRTQDRNNGCWYLADSKSVEKAISTWSTAEAIECLDYSEEVLDSHASHHQLARRTARWKVAGIAAIGLAVGEGVVLLGWWAKVAVWWNSLPKTWRDFIVTGIVLATVIGVISTLLLEALKKAWHWVIEGIKRQLSALSDR